jgi:hypothetical protein
VIVDLIKTPITTLFNHCVTTGYIPDNWAWGYIIPIYKPGGNAFHPSEYRPITVGTLLAKIYASCLNLRLTAWSDTTGIRATGQAGFRRGFRTSDHAFTLRTIIEIHRAADKGLYCCFVDFKKAYDCIPRDKLWEKLKTRGLTGWLLRAIQTLYANTPVCVRLNGGFSATFPAMVGLRQGCPLSPLLFGLYIDDLEPLVLQNLSSDLPLFGTRLIPPLLYADDLVLISTTPGGLQAQLDTLQTFAATWGLTVNLKKTEIVVFKGSKNHIWTLNSLPVPISDSFVYLGHHFAGSGSLSTAGNLRASRATAAFHAMRRRAAAMTIHGAADLCWLFDSPV